MLASVKKCWASAFNARACEYRNKQHIPHVKALMAVAVQVMINPVASGTGGSASRCVLHSHGRINAAFSVEVGCLCCLGVDVFPSAILQLGTGYPGLHVAATWVRGSRSLLGRCCDLTFTCRASARAW